MAIPFVLPSEEDSRSEVELEQLLGELIDINQQIQILLRARMLNRATHTSQRACPARHHRVHQYQHQPTAAAQPSSMLPDLVRSSLPPSAPGEETRADGQVTARRHRISDAEAACCYHAKYAHMLTQDHDATSLPLMTATAEVDVDWKQTAERLPCAARAAMCATPTPSQPPSCLEEAAIEDRSLLAKIIPATTSSRSLWTAVICVVGWHIFRAR